MARRLSAIGKHGLGTKKSISDGLLNDEIFGGRPVGGPGRDLETSLVWSDEGLPSDGVFEYQVLRRICYTRAFGLALR